MATSPRFSVVIPTRDRAHTLRHTLRTCIAQQFDDAEFLVSDNGSDAAARAVVEELADRRLQYVHTPQPLAMTDSWEFAIKQARGEFVTIVGDDDGLLLHALPEIDRVLTMTGGKVLRWETLYYCWPCLPAQSLATANRLYIPLRRRRPFYRVRRRVGRGRIAATINGKATCSDLPMIYRSMVHQSVLAKLRQKSGRVLASRSPDIYSGFAVASAAGEYHSIDEPLGISAMSGKSNGLNVCGVSDSSTATDFAQLNGAAGIRRHELAPDLTVMSAIVADSYLHARAALFPADRGLAINRRKLVSQCIGELRANDESAWRRSIGKLRESLADDPKLVRWFNRRYGHLSWQPAGHTASAPPRRYGGGYLHLDTSEFGVTNVFEAAELFEKLMGYRTDGVDVRSIADVRVRLALIADRVSAKLRTIRGKLYPPKVIGRHQPEA